LERYGPDVAATITWSGTRLLCIAQDFTRYDEHAVAQIDRNIELIRQAGLQRSADLGDPAQTDRRTC
jgi:hypothetical protein